MLPFHNVNLKKTGVPPPKKVIVPQTRYFLQLPRLSPMKKKVHRTANLLFSAFCESLTKKWSSCATPDIVSPQIKCCFRLLKMKNARIKSCFALVKNLCENAGKYFTLFCACREHCRQSNLNPVNCACQMSCAPSFFLIFN